jgi:hypothetical protein
MDEEGKMPVNPLGFIVRGLKGEDSNPRGATAPKQQNVALSDSISSSLNIIADWRIYYTFGGSIIIHIVQLRMAF